MLMANAFVWRFLIRALHENHQSALIPTLISTSFNFFISALLGILIFSEKTNLIWWIGALMIITGLYLVMSDNIELINKTE